jgi:hypothetical protein
MDIKEIFIHIEVSRSRSVIYELKGGLGVKKKPEEKRVSKV